MDSESNKQASSPALGPTQGNKNKTEQKGQKKEYQAVKSIILS